MTVEDDELNVVLAASLEWGQDWLALALPRLQELFPHISPVELGHCAQVCDSIRSAAVKVVQVRAIAGGCIDQALRDEVDLVLLAKWEWISDENLCHLFSQACYYSQK